MKKHIKTLENVKKLLNSKDQLDEHFLGVGNGKSKNIHGATNNHSIYELMKDETDEEYDLTTEQKKSFMEAVGKYNSYADSIYREHSLKEIVKEIYAMGKLAEKIIMSENDDWFDKLTVKKDMQELKKDVVLFEKTSREASQLQHRLESVYEAIGQRLSRYFEIQDNNSSIPGSTLNENK